MIGRRVVAAGVVVAAVTTGAIAGALIGVPGLSGASGSPNAVTAASESTTTTSPDGSDHHVRGFHRAGGGLLDAAAKALNLSPEDLLQKLSDGTTTIADVAKAQNVPLSDVTDAMKAVADKQIDDMVNKPFPKLPDFKGGRHGGMRGPGGFGGGFIGGLRGSFDDLAKTLGVTPEVLKNDLADGKSIADIATANNVDVNTVIDSLVADAKGKVDQAVKDGHLSQDQATKIEADLKDRITDLVNNGFKMPDFGGKFGHGEFPGPGGPGGFFPGGPSGASGADEAPAAQAG